jgi:crotonobetainyl-CoA:carnitine CoA-transferase CaiB-like acyl-CoA transferase
MATLDGIRVVDFGQYIAGPLAAMMLADHGAEVIHVDPPGGPRWNVDADAFYNRGKQRIMLDLRSIDDTAIAQRLAGSADVVVENFRPGVMDRLALGAAACCAANPALIYCSIPGFASDDPRRDVAAWEGVVGAATDIYPPISQLLDETDERTRGDPERPVLTALPLASNFAAFHAATAIVMALIERQRSGLGQSIEVPLFDAMFELIGANGISLNGVYPVGRTRGSRTIACADGRHILFNSTSSPRFQRFAAAAGATGQDVFRTRSAAEWETAVNTAGGPTTLVRTPQEWLASPHARARGAVVQLEDPLLGPTWMPGTNVHLTDSPGEIHARHVADADRAAVLAAAGALRSLHGDGVSRAPLAGVRVLDLTQVVAGPCTGRILVEYGADTIKVNNARPESLTTAVSLSMRPMDPGNQQHEHLNRGKQTLLLDLHTPEGQAIIQRLIDRSDVLMQNFALGMAERYGIGFEQVQQRRPDLVYFSLSAYGYGGPMQSYRGYEGNAQAVTGLMDRFGGDGPPLGQPYLLDDYGTGIRGAFAIALGVYHRQKTGRGQHIDIALVETATYHQAPYLLDYAGKKWRVEPRGPEALGWSPLQRLYRARDSWFFLGARSFAELGGVEGLDDALDEATLEQRFAEELAVVWVARLRRGGIGAHATARVEELMQDAWVRAHGLSISQHIDGLGEMVMPGVAARLSRTPLRVGAAVHPVGSDAPAILESVGLANEVDRLISVGAIRLEQRVPSGVALE